MAKRKRRRFGAIRPLPSGRFQARYQDGAGRQHTAPTTFATWAEADRFLSLTEADLRRGAWTDHRMARMTFRDLAERWWDGAPPIRPKTEALYGYLLKVHLLPTFGDVPIGDIDPMAVRVWRKRTLGKVSASTTAKAYRLLRQILDLAVRDGFIVKSPCDIKGAAKEPVTEMEVPSPDQVRALVEAFDPRYKALVQTALYAGLRFGELIALRRRHVDLLHRRIKVEENATSVNGGPPIVGPPKTAAGTRTITIPAPLVAVLDNHLRNWGGPGADGLVFPAPDGGYISYGNFRRRMWLPAAKKAGMVGFHMHQLRHFHGTYSAAVGAGTKEIMARMGQASPRAAMLYQHLVPGRDEVIAKELGALMDAVSNGTEASQDPSNGTPMARDDADGSVEGAG